MEFCKIPLHFFLFFCTAWNYRAFACSCGSLWHVGLIFQCISNLHLFKCVQRAEGWHCIIHQNVPFEAKGWYYLNHQAAALLTVKRQIFEERLLKVFTQGIKKKKVKLCWYEITPLIKWSHFSPSELGAFLICVQQYTVNIVLYASRDKKGHCKP